MHRTRAITTARLAQAQLGQGDLEPAVATAMSIPADVFTRHPRVTQMVGVFGIELSKTTPSSSLTRTWDQYTHSLGRSNT
jgi:hypothetical protein